MSSGYNSPVMWSDTDEEDDILVIGIDFGTTFSGVAWATVEDFESKEINIVTSWPGTGREEGKAPTELFYEDDNIMWGFDVPRDGDPVRWFKLLLLKEEDLDPELRTSEFLFRARKMLRENGKTAVDLIADYLRGLWAHTIQTIEKARGKSVVDALQFRVVLTVPAIWKGYARQSMEAAARQAGILSSRPGGDTDLVFAPEPEAAALSTLCEKLPRPVPGSLYVICDGGGGTADLISYEVTSRDPICLDEAVEGKGGLCGGIFVDEEFERICKARLGRKWDHLSKTGIKEVMKGEWEYDIKPRFKLSSRGDAGGYIVSIPAEAFSGSSLDDKSREPFIQNGRIHFSWEHIEKAFKNTVAGIGALIDQQIGEASKKGKSVTGVILVGGFGASPYLYEYVQNRYAKSHLDVLQAGGIKPRTAICRGAVFKGFLSAAADGAHTPKAGNIVLPIKVNSTISRASFGLQYDTPWVKGEYAEEDKHWDDVEEAWKARYQIDWYIKRGDLVATSEPVRRSYYYTYRKDPGPYFSIAMHQCEDEQAPSRKIKSVTKLCTIDCVFDAPFSSLPTMRNASGEKYRKMTFDVVMVPSGVSVEFSVYFDGRKQGGKNAAIKFM